MSQLPQFTITHNTSNGRLGTFSFERDQEIKTPFLFPVAFLMTGTTARGGATWKYILQDQDEKIKEHTLMRRGSPILSQVLHFLDYKVSPNGLNNWREKSIRGLYNEQLTDLNYQAPIFLDSGGFKLMWRTGLDLERYDISLEQGKEAKSILQLQRDLKGDIIATLDYPLPPNLLPKEAKKRMRRSRENAIQTAQLLRSDQEFKDYNPFLFMAVHGLSSQAISAYVRALFNKIEKEELGDSNFGLAIGSLVPLRTSRNTEQIINLVRTTIKAIPEKYQTKVPIHVFGVTGLLVPFLAYLGIDTFDSSTFAQEARALKYLLPQTFQRRNILEMSQNDVTSCQCPICKNMDLQELQTSLVSEIVGKPQLSGHYKSKYYADIALHNFELDLEILKKTRAAIEANNLDEYLLEVAKDIPRMQSTLTVVAAKDKELKRKASRFILPKPQPSSNSQSKTIHFISLDHDPDDFDISANGYSPEKKKNVLLIIPCSREKPYSNSHSHRYLTSYLETDIPSWLDKIDKVTLSGLYGPVPLKYEQNPPVMEYDFRLVINNHAQISKCTDRLVEFLRKHGEFYDHCVAYGTSNAYRTVFEKAAGQYNRLLIFPQHPKSRRLREFYRPTNIVELIEYLQEVVANET